MEKVRRIQCTEMVWNFTASESHLAVNRLAGEYAWFDKITATIIGDGVTPIHFVVEVWNHDGISPSGHDQVKKLIGSLQGNPNVSAINELGRFPAKYIAGIDFRLQRGVPVTYRACDGLKTIVNALWFGEIHRIQRPAPKVSQWTIVDDGTTRITYGQWLDRVYFGLESRTLVERLFEARGKQVRLRVLCPSTSGTEEHVGVLGVFEGNGWIIDGNTANCWPLISVEWVDVLPE